MGNLVDRRSHRRVDLDATATLLERGDPVGRFTVQNLSPSGALLTGAHDVTRAAPLRLLLELPDGEPLAVGAHVRRRAQIGNMVALAVAFRHLSDSSEDRIQDAIVALLDQRYRAEHPAVVLVEPDPKARDEITARLQAMGRRTIACAAPLDAMRILESDEPLEAVIARDGVDTNPELLTWVAENHPDVRSVLLIEDRKSDPSVAHLHVTRCFPEHLADVLS